MLFSFARVSKLTPAAILLVPPGRFPRERNGLGADRLAGRPLPERRFDDEYLARIATQFDAGHRVFSDLVMVTSEYETRNAWFVQNEVNC